MSTDLTPMLTAAEVATRLGTSEHTVRRWIRNGELPALRIGGRIGYRIAAEDLADFERRRRVTSALTRELLDATIGDISQA